ncbi:hypothetical protein D5086_026671 [Populus alba]|uniref:Uncharacterized protein n=1 Tax=Populus alba TaxID=43335 RepID=A0ACC4B410_POPAL
MKSYGNVTGMKDAWLTLAAALDQVRRSNMACKLQFFGKKVKNFAFNASSDWWQKDSLLVIRSGNYCSLG